MNPLVNVNNINFIWKHLNVDKIDARFLCWCQSLHPFEFKKLDLKLGILYINDKKTVLNLSKKDKKFLKKNYKKTI